MTRQLFLRRGRPAAIALLTAVTCAVSAAAAQELATDWAESYNARTRLAAARIETAGQDGLFGFVEMEMPPGWKTYWIAPGESGLPPSFDWSKSQNVAEVRVLFPVPRRLSDAGGEVIGYQDAVSFPVALKALDPTKPILLDLLMQFGICKDICVPAEIKLSLEVPVDTAAEASPSAYAALQRVPRQADRREAGDPIVTKAVAELDGASPRLVIAAEFPGGGGGAELFLAAPGGAYLPPPSRVEENGDVVTFVVDLSSDVDVVSLKGQSVDIVLAGAKGQTAAALRIE